MGNKMTLDKMSGFLDFLWKLKHEEKDDIVRKDIDFAYDVIEDLFAGLEMRMDAAGKK